MPKACAVPGCYNTAKTIPKKLFVAVPWKKDLRKMWLILAKIDPNSDLHSIIFFCEDHFDVSVIAFIHIRFTMNNNNGVKFLGLDSFLL